MDKWADIRASARRLHAEVGRDAGRAERADTSAASSAGEFNAAEMLAATGQMTGIARYGLPANDPLLYGAHALLDRDTQIIWYNAEADEWLALYHQAHEFAHYFLGHETSPCTAQDLDFAQTEDATNFGVARVEGYGPHQRRECEANVFAREFLLPREGLRRWFIENNLNADSIAARVGLDAALVQHQLAHALLTPETNEAEEQEAQTDGAPLSLETNAASSSASDARESFPLDASQRAAARSEHTPLLVAAGPGTGKTRALIGRILYLLETGVEPQSILTLTFSNKAAEEMRERVRLYAPEAAGAVWMGTFHSFGLEILRRYWQEADLPSKPIVIDPVDAIFILEKHLPQLRLDHYQNLYEPTTKLGDILAAISRAKDEVTTPDEYEKLARRMRECAEDDKGRERAERALEVARCYRIYQNYLERERLLDFGDLIFRAVRLLRENETVRRSLRAQFPHALVDEYQDVNRASGLLLKEMTDKGAGLWAVGDIRQGIYRWRGASPAQMRWFSEDFPKARNASLKINYRSRTGIVNTVSTFAAGMRVNRAHAAHAANKQVAATDADDEMSFAAWHAHRESADARSDQMNDKEVVSTREAKIAFEIATGAGTEARMLARHIKAQAEGGGAPYREQAIICRTHTQLARFARALEAESVPALYLGDIFERAEVKDLLALLQLACDGTGRSLPRVARFPEYNVPLRDVSALLAHARERDLVFPEALDAAEALTKISPPGKDGLSRMSDHLRASSRSTTAWSLIARYLFNESRYLAALLRDDSIRAAQTRLAIYQFLQFVYHERERDAQSFGAATTLSAKQSLLAYVRRLKMFGEEKILSQVPQCAESLDAVRLLTVHAAKGLEWSRVYLPHLGVGSFPNKRTHNDCPPPAGMIKRGGNDAPPDDSRTDENFDAEEQAAEEECLFFVALSRARDGLLLSRAASYTEGRRSNPSEFLARIAGHLAHAPDGAATWTDKRNDSKAPARVTETNAREVSLAGEITGRAKPHFSLRQIEIYAGCPRQFFYEQRLNLSGKRDDAAYRQFHSCVYETLNRVREEAAMMTGDEREATRAARTTSARAYLKEIWRTRTVAAHPYSEIYFAQAARMIENFIARQTLSRGAELSRSFDVELESGFIRISPDCVETTNGVVLLQRIWTGRATASEVDREIYGLYYELARQHFPTLKPRVQILYLATNDAVDVELTERKIASRLKKYDAFINGIINGDFPAHPKNIQNCPQCAHFFTCPAAEE